MRKQRLFIRSFSAFLAILLLLVATVGKSFSVHKETKKAATEQTKGKQSSEERPNIGELSTDLAVAPSVSFDFVQDFYILPRVVILECLTVALPKKFDVFYYFFSFFRNVFGHHIAINAP